MSTMLVWPLPRGIELVVETSGEAFFFDRGKFARYVPDSRERVIEEVNNRYPQKYRYPAEIPITTYLTLREKFTDMEMSREEEAQIGRQVTQLYKDQLLAAP